MTADPWWQGLGPAEAVLECEGDHHTLRWERGRLTAAAHRDVEGEQALSALAGNRPPCLEVLGLSARHAEDPRMLVLAGRGPGDRLVVGANRPRWVAYAPMQSMTTARAGGGAGGLRRPSGRAPLRPRLAVGRGTEEDAAPLVTLAALAGPLFDRLASGVAAVWADRIEAGDERVAPVRPALDAALYGRVVLAARRWLADPTAEVVVDVIGPHDQPEVSRRDGALVVAVPFSWLVSVWARGLEVVLGRLVLAASTGPGGLVLDTLTADLSTRLPLTIGLAADSI